MTSSSPQLQSIYLAMVGEAVSRLRAAREFLADYDSSPKLPLLEAAILQVRKALEALAFASIAPNKEKYETFRAEADDQPDYTKDYHAKKIFHVLTRINKDFYPLALLPAVRLADGTVHFGRKPSGYLTKKRFEAFYDRLGKYLHAHNPWGDRKHLHNLVGDLPAVIEEAFSLLELHATFIQAPEFKGAWIVEAHRNGSSPRIVTGVANGDFLVEKG